MIDPVEVMRHYHAMNREAFRLIYWFVENKGMDGAPDWAPWCFVPLSAVYAALQPKGKIPVNKGVLIGIMGTLATWRVSQGIYRFDSDVFADLWDTALDESIDESVLFRLPEFCVYIEVVGKTVLDKDLSGFWVHLEQDANTKGTELRLLLNMSDGLLPIAIHLGQGDLIRGIKQSLATSMLYNAVHGEQCFHALQCGKRYVSRDRSAGVSRAVFVYGQCRYIRSWNSGEVQSPEDKKGDALFCP